MFQEKRILKKVFAFICVAGFCISVNSATNGRGYALGQPYFLGDIINSTGQGWQMLGYPDQIQGSADYTTPDGKPGPVIMIKSLGEYCAIGATLNTFDRRTGGSVLASTAFLKKAMEYSGSSIFYDRFPNWPQLHFGFKIGQQKFGIDGWYEMQNYGINDNFNDSVSTRESKKDVSVKNIGGKISARFAFGNLAWNPWFAYGVPYLDGTYSDDFTLSITDTVLQNTTDMTFSMNKADRLLTFGSCLDYTFGDWGWAIIGGWYRNETFQFKTQTEELSTLNGSTIYSHDSTTISPRYNNSFYDYFVSVTPNIFENFLIGFEYQGGFMVLNQKYEDKSQTDTSLTTIYNDLLICMEKPINANRRLVDVFTVRGALRWAVGRNSLKVTRPDGTEQEWINGISTMIDEMEGMFVFFGIGYKKKRVTVDLALRMLQWKQLAILNGPPPGSITLTVDLH